MTKEYIKEVLSRSAARRETALRDEELAARERAVRAAKRKQAAHKEQVQLNVLVLCILGIVIIGIIIPIIHYSYKIHCTTVTSVCKEANVTVDQMDFISEDIEYGETLKGISKKVSSNIGVSEKTAYYFICGLNEIGYRDTNHLRFGVHCHSVKERRTS